MPILAESESMALVKESKQRALLLLQIDRTFKDYRVQLSPIEARSFVQISENAGQKLDAAVFMLLVLIDETIPLADRGPGHPENGRPHHVYEIGRTVGHRMLTLKIWKRNLPPDFNYAPLQETLRAYAKSVEAIEEFDESPEQILGIFQWVDKC